MEKPHKHTHTHTHTHTYTGCSYNSNYFQVDITFSLSKKCCFIVLFLLTLLTYTPLFPLGPLRTALERSEVADKNRSSQSMVYRMGPGDQSQVASLQSKCLHPLNCNAGPVVMFLSL